VIWFFRVLVTFHFICLGWIIFRCEEAYTLPALVTRFMDVRGWFQMPAERVLPVLAYVTPLLAVELFQLFKKKEQVVLDAPIVLRTALYLAGIWAFIVFGRFEGSAFIYFQF
jgi:hypothetical protein